MKKQYCAIIGDINKSRELRNRNKAQLLFGDAINAINKEFEREIASKFLITIGDEFQGLLNTPAMSYHIVRRFQDIMKDIPFAFGIGIGTLATKVNPQSAIGMDGECFYRARAALIAAKKSGQEVLYDFDHPSSHLVNLTIGVIERRWKKAGEKQKLIMKLHKMNKSQTEIAEIVKTSQQNISKTISSRSVKELDELVEGLLRYFQSFEKIQVTPK
ncbi:MAG: SatD family protein [Bacteroidota bacterium]